MTVEEFAKRMDVTPRTVWNWLGAGLVPNAVQREPRGWYIPHSALKMKTPKPGRRPARHEQVAAGETA